MKIRILFTLLVCISVLGSISEASDWTHWRGPMQTGASPETGLVSTWSLEGENLIWRRRVYRQIYADYCKWSGLCYRANRQRHNRAGAYRVF